MKETISKKKLREFGFLIGFGIPLIVGLFLPLIGGHSFRTWTLIVSFPVLFLGIIRPDYLFYPYKIWMKIGHILGWINSRIISGIVFILVLQPIALIMKFFGYDPLRRKKKEQTSYRESKEGHKIDLKRIF